MNGKNNHPPGGNANGAAKKQPKGANNIFQHLNSASLEEADEQPTQIKPARENSQHLAKPQVEKDLSVSVANGYESKASTVPSRLAEPPAAGQPSVMSYRNVALSAAAAAASTTSSSSGGGGYGPDPSLVRVASSQQAVPALSGCGPDPQKPQLSKKAKKKAAAAAAAASAQPPSPHEQLESSGYSNSDPVAMQQQRQQPSLASMPVLQLRSRQNSIVAEPVNYSAAAPSAIPAPAAVSLPPLHSSSSTLPPAPPPSMNTSADGYGIAQVDAGDLRVSSMGTQNGARTLFESAYGAYAPSDASLTRIHSQSQQSQSPTSLASSSQKLPPAPAPLMQALPWERRGFSINWNEEFQRLIEMPETSEQLKLEKYEKLSALWTEFVHKAKSCGKIIISELFLEPSQRTIPTCAVGGTAGGVKYIYHGILFKFARDEHGIYAGDHFAQKAAGHELKGLMRYFTVEGLHVPLMALIDYKGHRLVAMSILPIDPERTLQYGSKDGGRTVLNADPDLSRKMENAAKKLNLKGHMAGLQQGTRRFLYACTDIEGHIGLDNRHYVLDFARVFPPTYSPAVQHTFLYQLMRPEFVKRWHCPLSSDAFSRFGGADNESEGHNKEVVDATFALRTQMVPALAASLCAPDQHSSQLEPQFRITELIHRAGVNARYIGLVRGALRDRLSRQASQDSNCAEAMWMRWTMQEMLARVVKNELRAKMRAMRTSHTLRGSETAIFAEDQLKKQLVAYFNVLLGHGDDSKVMWCQTMKQELARSFEGALATVEQQPSHDLRQHVEMFQLFRRVQQLTGIKLSRVSMRELEASPATFRMVLSDIKKLSARVKGLNILALAEGNALTIQAGKSAAHSDMGAARLFRFAIRQFEAAIRSTPDNVDVLNTFASALCHHATRQRSPESLHFLTLAFHRYKLAGNLPALLELGTTLQGLLEPWWQEQAALLQLAIQCFQELTRAATASPTLAFLACRQWGHLLLRQARLRVDDDAYARAGEKYRAAMAMAPPASEPLWIGLAAWAPQRFDDAHLATVVELAMQAAHSIDVRWAYRGALLTDDLLTALAAHSPALNTLRLRGCTWLQPKTFGALARSCRLIHVDISNCTQVDDATLKPMLLSSIRSLRVAGTRVSSRSVFAISESAAAVEELDLASTSVDEEGLAQLAFLTRLSSISLAHCKHLGYDTCRQLGDLVPAARQIDLSGCGDISEGTLKNIGERCSLLTSLNLRGCMSVNLNLSLGLVLSRTTRLDSLDIGDTCDTRDLVMKHVVLLPKLRNLSLRSCEKLTDEGLKLLTSCPPLESLDLAHCYRLGDAVAASLLRQHSTLLRIDLTNCLNVSDRTLEHLPPRLVSLVLVGCVPITNKGVASIARLCSSLETLDLSLCKEITDVGLEALASSRSRSLQVLRFNKCNLITSTGLQKITATFHKIRELELRECLCVSNVGFLPTNCPDLALLDLYGCEQLVHEGIIRLAALHHVRYLNLQRCKRMRDDALQAIGKGCPSLRALVLGFNKTTDFEIEQFAQLRPTIHFYNDGYIYKANDERKKAAMNRLL